MLFEPFQCFVISGEPNSSVRFGVNLVAELFGSADFFRLLLNSSVRFAEQFGKILAEQFGSAEFQIGKVRFGSVRRKKSEFGSPLYDHPRLPYIFHGKTVFA